MNNFFIKIFLIISLIAHKSAFCQNADKIIAIVNNTSITSHDLAQFQKIMDIIYSTSNKKLSLNKITNTNSLQEFIDSLLLQKAGVDFAIKISSKEIESFINALEKSNQLSNGYYKSLMDKNHINFEYFKNKIKSELILQKIIQSYFASEHITKNDIEQFVVNNNLNSMKFSFKVFHSKDLSKKSYAKMSKLIKVLKNCNDTVYKDYLDNYISMEESDDIFTLSPLLIATAKSLKENDLSPILQNSNNFTVIMMCRREMNQINNKDLDLINNNIVMHKVIINIKKFQDNLKKMSYIRIM